MKNIDQSTRTLKWVALGLATWVWVSGCGKTKDEAVVSATSEGIAQMQGHDHSAGDGHGHEVASALHYDPVELTAEQYANGKFALGKVAPWQSGAKVRANGVVEVPPENLAMVSPLWGGFVREMTLLQGHKVAKGQTLFTLENPEFVEMQQQFLEAKGSLAYLKADYEIQQQLAGEKIAAQKTYLKAESDYRNTVARYEALKKKLSMMGISPDAVSPENLRSTIAIPSPISGYVTEIHATRGQYLHPSDVAIGIANTDHIHLELGVYEKDVPKLREKQVIQFHLPDDPGHKYEAFIHLIGKTVEPEKRTVNVHGHLKDEGQSPLFTPGMYVEAEILTGADENVSSTRVGLPESAVVKLEDGYAVLVKKASAAGKYIFQPVEVKVGATVGGQIEILNPKALDKDAEILTQGGFALMGGMLPHLH